MRSTATKFWRTTGSKTLMTSWGKLISFFGYNDGNDVYLQLHRSASPTNDTIICTLYAPAKTPFSLDVPVIGMDFPALYLHQSSTPLTYTAAAANSIGFTTVLA